MYNYWRFHLILFVSYARGKQCSDFKYFVFENLIAKQTELSLSWQLRIVGQQGQTVIDVDEPQSNNWLSRMLENFHSFLNSGK